MALLTPSRLNFSRAIATLPTLFVAPLVNPGASALIQEILEEYYFDGIDDIVSAELDDGGDIVGEFTDRVGAREVKRYQYRIEDDEVSYGLLNSKEVARFALTFAPMFGAGSRKGKKKTCAKSTPCGDSCIQSTKKCRKKPGSAVKAKIKEAKEALGGNLALNSPDLPTNHVAGLDSRVTTAKIDQVLRDLEDNDNRENLAKFRQFVALNKTQVVVHKDGSRPSSEKLGKLALEVSGGANGFTSLRSVIVPRKNTWGFTSRQTNHVVLRHGKAIGFDPDAADIKANVMSSIKSESDWSFGYKGTKTQSDQTMLNYFHEMGHQIHYADFERSILDAPIGWKSLTKYGNTADVEFAAEHFMAWAIAPKQYQKADPIGYDWIDTMVSQSLKKKRFP